MNASIRRRLICGALLALIGVVLSFAASGGPEDCKVCGQSAGVTVCLLADEWEVGHRNCYAGPVCFYLPGGVERCFDDACWANDPCDTPPI